MTAERVSGTGSPTACRWVRPYAARMSSFKIASGARLLVPAVLACALALAACGDDPKPAAGPGTGSTADASQPTDAPQPADAPTEQASLPPGAQPGVDDYNGDGTPDPTCTIQDFGGGLILRIPCEISNANGPEDGTQLVPDSLYRLPAHEADLTGISGSLITARDVGGKKIVIVVFNSDNLFATGSDQINESNTLDATIRLINSQFAGGAVQVRGHTDSTGTAAANQALSGRRAENVRSYLTSHDLRSAEVTAIGFGSTRPLVAETNPDGTASLPGRSFNRRVEIAIRLP
jgi:outer membrane protein OmpA-like peptidoglycan-associated protein